MPLRNYPHVRGVSRRSASLLAVALVPASLWALPPSPSNQASAATQPAESDCESCSNSNSSLQDGDKSFITTASGLRYLDLKPGTGAAPQPGQLCVVDWVGYTAGYQAKRIESTRETDEPFRFVLGKVIACMEAYLRAPPDAHGRAWGGIALHVIAAHPAMKVACS